MTKNEIHNLLDTISQEDLKYILELTQTHEDPKFFYVDFYIQNCIDSNGHPKENIVGIRNYSDINDIHNKATHQILFDAKTKNFIIRENKMKL